MPLLWWTEHLLSAVNGLTNSPQIFHITQRDFFNLKYFNRDQLIWSTCCRSALNQVLDSLPCYLWKGPLKRDFLGTYLTASLAVRTFKTTSTMSVKFFFKKGSKLNLNLENSKKKHKIFFVSGINVTIISKCCYKLSLLRTEYLLSAVNGLTNSPQTFHITQRVFLNLNCFHRHQ